MSINYTHCLRRQFTENILTHLLKNNSVNVIVPKGVEETDREADRFVKDIQQCELSAVRVLVANMRFCRGSYRQFLLDLWQQYQQQPLKEVPDLFKILSDLEQAEQQFIIVLNHLDAMCADDVDAQFDQDFYIHLNSLKNYRHVALLVITKGTSYHGMSFNMGGEFKTSKLDIQEIEDLPALTGDEVRYELRSRHPELSGVHISHVMAQVQQGASYDYGLLDYLSRQLKHSTQPWDDMSRFIRQLKSWYQQYKRLQSKQAEYHAQKAVGAADKISSIFKVKHLFSMGYDILRTVFLEWPIVLIEKISEVYKKRKD